MEFEEKLNRVVLLRQKKESISQKLTLEREQLKNLHQSIFHLFFL